MRPTTSIDRLAGANSFARTANYVRMNSHLQKTQTPLKDQIVYVSRSKQSSQNNAGFTLLEVLVALVIVGTALGASLRAVSSLTQNAGDLRASMMATWSAENRLTQIRLAQQWPSLGQHSFDCPQGELKLACEENVTATPNPYFRRVEVSVFDLQSVGEEPHAGRRIIKLSQVVPNAQ